MEEKKKHIEIIVTEKDGSYGGRMEAIGVTPNEVAQCYIVGALNVAAELSRGSQSEKLLIMKTMAAMLKSCIQHDEKKGV